MNNAAKLIIVASVAALLPLFAGCSQSYIKEIDVPTTPKYITPPARSTQATQTNDGSLYTPGSRFVQVNDFRAYDINDLVTINVVENTTASNSANVDTEREDTGKRGITSLLGLQDRLLPRSVNPASAIDASTEEEFASTGSMSRSERISTTLTARVVDRLPNGNLIIQAVREIIVSHERQVMVVQGIIRPVDIDDSNSIPSTKIADLQIQFGGTGVLSENLRRGWLSRFVNYIWPF